MTYHGIGGAGYVLPGAQVYSAVVAAAAGGGGFAPTDISGCVLWLDASDVTSLYTDDAGTTPVSADGDAIGRWSDKSGEAHHVTQATAGNKPTYKTGVQNGLSVIRGDGNDFLNVPNLSLSNSSTIFAVVRWLSSSADGGILGGKSNNDHQFWRDEFASGDRMGIAVNGAAIVAYGTHLPATNTGYAYMWRYNSGTSAHTVHVDGVSDISVTASLGAGVLQPDFIFAANTSTAKNLTGDIGEIAIFNSALGTTDVNSMESYLATKWGL